MKRFWWIFLLFFAAASASALDVQDVKWGFDGQVVPDRFNVLSVLVYNASPEPFDGALNLYKTRGPEERVGAIYASPCYISPMTARWVQFYVYLDSQYFQYDTWRVEWGNGLKDHNDIDAPKAGPPAQVLLSDSDMIESGASAFKQFPEDLFPLTGAALSGLDTVLLDHVPRWEPAKRQAFLDWLRAGGKVHLLMGPDGHYPVFSDDLSMLNSSQDRMRIGAGLAVRHAATVRNFRKEDLGTVQIPWREFKPGESMPSQVTESLLQSLAQLSRRQYDWGWIYLLAMVYIGLIGPGHLVLGRKVADYRLRIVLLVAAVGAFAWIFNLVGRRGQGEASVVHTLSYARAIDGDTYDVTQWINVFATHGANYTIQHNAPHNLYATGQDYEAVNGMIESGTGGRFLVDIPMFSRRALMHEGEMKGANIPVKILNWEGTGRLKHLTLTVGPEFTKEIIEGWVVQGNKVYSMTLRDGRLEFENSNSESLKNFLPAKNSQQFGSPYGYGYQEEVTNVQAHFQTLVTPLIGWSFGEEDWEHEDTSSPMVEQRAQLFLFARSPDSFRVIGSDLGRETGYVLYHFDLFKPES